ncbi:2-amino-4-hydroxy-6-hydroxymethyldihydropteridine diphosphokinase [Omnitrophica bacterium]|nr:2-amino-4-hydroxy-6-hydroxymethyldihydropteridine diphosphokinase [Candidatus Omnitrophota bacterium]
MTLAYIGVGSNVGNRESYLQAAHDRLSSHPEIKFTRMSRVHETEPVGGPAQEKYLNAVWEIETDLTAEELLECTRQVEQDLGRVRSVKNGPRTMDLDILFFGSEVMDRQELTIPHPRLRGRAFVLEPLAELSPDWVHPVTKTTVRQLWEETIESY